MWSSLYLCLNSHGFSVIHVSTKKERKTLLEFLKLSLDASVFDHITSTTRLSGLKRFLAVFLSNKIPPFFFCPSSLLPLGESSCIVQFLVGVFVCQKVFCVCYYKLMFPLKSILYFLAEHLSSLVVCPVSLREENKSVNVLTFLKPDLFWRKTPSGLNSPILS